MKKIGIDARFYATNFTGIGRYNAELIKWLAELDQEHEYVIFLNDPQFAEFVEPNKRFKKVRVNARHYSLAEQTKFLWKIWKEKLDLMHFTHFNAPLLYRGRSVVTIHDLTLEKYPGKKMTGYLHRLGYGLVLRNIVRKAKKILSVSKNTKKDLEEILRINGERIVVTYNGMDAKFCAEKDEKLQASLLRKYRIDRPFILYTGVWRTHKNLPRLVEAFNLVREKYKLDVLLVLTGKPDRLYNEVEDKIAELGLEDVVRKVGLVPEKELPVLYTLARGYVFPSLYEGFGLPPLEAMACGTPVAVSKVSSIPEVCGKQNAIYFNPEDVEEMAEKINLLLTDEELREKLIAGGFKQIKKFDWKKTTEETLQVYNEVLDEGN